MQWDKSLTGLNLDVMTKNLLGLTDQMDQAQLRHSQTQCKRSQKTWTLGTGKSVAWPAGVGGKGNAGVAGVIRNTDGAIGYVNQSYINDEVVAAALQNKSGEFLKPSVEAGAIALNGITLDENLAGKNPNPTAKGAYPIATLTWILAYENGNGRNTKPVKTALSTLLSDEYQAKAPKLGFVPLKGDILAKSRAAVERIGK